MYLLQKKTDRKSDNAKGKQILYEEFEMADYLHPGDKDITIEEQKWLFKCRVEDVDIKGNHKWKHTNIFCSSCQQNEDETQFHLLNCFALLGKNEVYHISQNIGNYIKEVCQNKYMFQEFLKKTISTEFQKIDIMLYGPCELAISSPCSTACSFGSKYIYFLQQKQI